MKVNKLRKGAMVLVGTLILFIHACGLNQQKNAMKNLANCKYELVGIDSLSLAGADLQQLLNRDQIDLAKIPAIAFGYLNKNLPLKAALQVEITNPTNHLAGVKEFEYIIQLDKTELLNGISTLPVSVPGQTTVIAPLRLETNIYKLISDANNQQKILQFFDNSTTSANPTVNLTIKVKPTIDLGNQVINYPGYVTIEKKLDKASLKRLLNL